MNTVEIYQNRRRRLISNLKDDGMIILFSGEAINKSEDECYDFAVNRNFYYLTGLENESMILLMHKLNGMYYEKLFILPYDETLAKWVGGRIVPEKATLISGIDEVLDVSDFKEEVTNLLNKERVNPNFEAYFDLWHYSPNQNPSEGIKCANEYKNTYPSLVIKDVYPLITSMRLVKDEYEIDCLRKAIAITDAGVREMMKNIKPGIGEMEMEGLFNYVLSKHNCNQNSFKTIAASGHNATILHYSANNKEIEDGSLFLCDLGATYNNYCADISRTFPANGKFSERQKEIYEIVLAAQELVRMYAKPGMRIRDLNKLVVSYYTKELPLHGLYKDVSEYYYHGVSHHLGLDTHDVDGGLGAILKEGNVISNEPGLYIEDENIGIRIEDDLLITKEGCEVLSSSIPKTIEDIEKLKN